MSKRIVILVHENTRFGYLGRWRGPKQRYFVSQLARHWREDGFQVRYLKDPASPIAGDLLFIHIDLSVVPEPYLALAQAYPVSINATVKDIRKSVISRQLVGPDDSWDGPVIVKTDLNYSGFPERRYAGAALAGSLSVVKSPGDYPVFQQLRDVPARHFDNPELVVERFLPEMIDGRYCIRSYNFFGDREDTFLLYGEQPVVKLGNITRIENTVAHPEIRDMRHALGFDYGKFDYVVHDGHAILLDANKTPGPLPVKDAATAAMLRRRAQGVHAFFA